jgi:hypothetical protein
MYHDPTYSLSAEEDSTMPIVVSRFYLEVSTKFTRNRITISDCTASNEERLLNGSTALKPRTKYCDNSTFDTRTESSPAGVTHMDRISMKKFKFHTTTDVFMQCKIRACAAQPCGTCQASRQLAASPDLSPVEGEMFAPPHKIRVSQFDKNALVFAAQEYTAPPAVQSSAVPAVSTQQGTKSSAPATTQPIQVASQLELPFTATWANENRAALASTLRSTLGLTASEDLVITSISAARRLGAERKLQASSVKVDFVVGVASSSRAAQASSSIGDLASGSSNVVASFAATLNQNLRNRGQATVEIDPAQIKFASAEITEASSSAMQTPSQAPSSVGLYSASAQQQQGGKYDSEEQESEQTLTVVKEGSSSNMLMIVLVVGGALVALYLLVGRKTGANKSEEAGRADAAGANAGYDAYSAKVADFGLEGNEAAANW